MPEPFLPLAAISLLAESIQFVADVKDAPEQIGFQAQNLEILFHLLGRIKTRLEYVQGASESAVDREMMCIIADGLFNTCRKLSLILGPFKDATGAAKNGLWIKLRWRLKRRRLNALEAELERWETRLNTEFNMSHWPAATPGTSLGPGVRGGIDNEGQHNSAKTRNSLPKLATMTVMPHSQLPDTAVHPTPTAQPSIGSLRDSINRSSWNVEEAEKRAFYQRLDQPSCASLPISTSRELLSARSLSVLSARAPSNSSIFDVSQDIPPEDTLEVVKNRLRLQDAQIEQEYTRSLSGSRLEAYKKLHAQSSGGPSVPFRPVPRSVSAPHLSPRRSIPSSGSDREQIEQIDSRSRRRSNQRLSSSSSHLSSIEEREPPVVRRHTKPSLESIASIASPVQHRNSVAHGPKRVPHPVSTSTSDRTLTDFGRSASTTPLGHSTRSHNSMTKSLPARNLLKKVRVQDRRIAPSPYPKEQENQVGPLQHAVISTR